MEEFLAVSLSFPTLVYSLPLVAAAIYWLTVLIGVADVDLLGGADALDAAAGHADGVAEAITGKLDAASHAAAGHADAGDATTAKAHALDSAADDGALAALLSALRLRRAPVTVSLSILFLVAWLVTFFASRYLAPALPLPEVVAGGLCAVLGLVVAWPLTAALTFPMGAIYGVRHGVRRADLVGRTVVVITSRVDANYGEGELADGGAGLLLQIRCAAPNSLAKGHEALLVAWESDREVYDVEPLAGLLDRPTDRG